MDPLILSQRFAQILPTLIPTLASFEEHGVVQKDEKDVAEEATVQLFKDGILEYSDGRYYLKGNVPRLY